MPRRSKLSRLGASFQEMRDARESNAKLAYERKVVRKLLRRAGWSDYDFKVNTPDAEDETYLTFLWLHDAMPSIPIRLMSHAIWKPRLSAFLRPTARNNPFWEKWKEVEVALSGEAASGTAIGCVFPTPDEMLLGDMIVHTLDIPFSLSDENETGFVRMHRVTKKGEHITLESLEAFALRLGMVWRL